MKSPRSAREQQDDEELAASRREFNDWQQATADRNRVFAKYVTKEAVKRRTEKEEKMIAPLPGGKYTVAAVTVGLVVFYMVAGELATRHEASKAPR